MHARTARDAFFRWRWRRPPPSQPRSTPSLRAAAALVWPEGRERPIRMLDRLPLVWAAAGALPSGGAAYRGEALRGEFFAFQVGVYAPTRALVVLSSWSELRADGGGARSSRRTGCVASTSPMARRRRRVGWRSHAARCSPSGLASRSPATSRPRRTAAFCASVRWPPAAPTRSCASNWSSVRGAWRLAATTSCGDTRGSVGSTPLQAPTSSRRWARHRARRGCPSHGTTARARCARAARAVKLTRRGLPASLRVGGVELLHGAAQLRLLRHNGRGAPMDADGRARRHCRAPGGGQRWTADGAVDGVGHGADGECAGLRVRIRGEMQSDGFAQMTAVLKAARSGGSGGAACVLQDVQLVLPLVAAETPLINGFGWKGAGALRAGRRGAGTSGSTTRRRGSTAACGWGRRAPACSSTCRASSSRASPPLRTAATTRTACCSAPTSPTRSSTSRWARPRGTTATVAARVIAPRRRRRRRPHRQHGSPLAAERRRAADARLAAAADAGARRGRAGSRRLCDALLPHAAVCARGARAARDAVAVDHPPPGQPAQPVHQLPVPHARARCARTSTRRTAAAPR